MSHDLASKATLVSMTVHMWGAKVSDESLAPALAGSQKADRDVFKIIKKLLPDHVIGPIKTIHNRALKEHNLMTMPGFHRGQRLLSNGMFIRYNTIMNGLKDMFQEAAQELSDIYPGILAAAPRRLGKSFDRNDFPEPDEIKKLYYIETKFSPVPNTRDWRLDQVDDEMIEKLRKDADEYVAAMYQNAHLLVMDRAKDILRRVAEQAKTYDPPGGNALSNGLFDDMKEMAAILPLMNVTNDPLINKIADEMTREFAELEPKEVRKNQDLRQAILKASEKMLGELSG